MNTATQFGYSYHDKTEAMRFLLREHQSTWRNGTPAQQEIYAIWRAIADDYGARDRARICTTAQRIEQALEKADRRKKPIYGYEAGNLREIAELVIGSWPVIRQALEEFERHV